MCIKTVEQRREKIKPRLRLELLSFRHAEHGHFLYFSNVRPVHAHSWFLNSVPAQMSLGKQIREGEMFRKKQVQAQILVFVT